MSLAPDVEARMKREHREKYARLAQTLGMDSLAGLVRDLVPRVVQALAAGDEHLNTITLATWDRLALGPEPQRPPACAHCGHRPSNLYPLGRSSPTLGAADWPYAELRATARDKARPWHRAPGLSLAERVCVLKYVAAELARATQPGDSNQ